MMNRAGLVNFWYYDEEEFDFSDGKLLLRGSNGSGKSVTMQSFIPLILDGNKSPERLDPFGSRARKIENYLLGEDTDKTESIGYIYMEFKKKDSQKYITIGMGLNAKRGKALKFWGFVLTDGRRIGKDILLYKEVGKKVPLSKKELKNRIGEGGEIRESQKEYMALVNKYLFGFEEIDDYDELIKLLIQLRTPKLSKNFKPTVIYEIMNNSLQPLSDDDLRPMSEAIENMDNIKNSLEELKICKNAADKVKVAYDKYNEYIIFEKAKNFVKSHNELRKLIKSKENLKTEKDEFHKEYNIQIDKIESLEIEEKSLKEKRKELEKHDSYKIKEEILKLEKRLGNLSSEKNQKENSLNKKKDKERELYLRIKKLEENESYEIDEIKELLEEMNELADEIKFQEHSYMKDELLKNAKKEYDFAYSRKQMNTYKEKIVKAKKILEEEKIKNKEYDNALIQVERSKNKKEEGNKRLESAKLLFLEIKEEFIENIYNWEKSNRELKLTQNTMINISQKVNSYGKESTFDDIIGEIRNEYNSYESGLNREMDRISIIKKQYDEELNQKKKEIKEWENKKDPEPKREEKVILNRERLKEQKIPFIPFYMAVDFQEGLTEDEKGRLEEALINMGILDALIIPSKYKDKVLETEENMADKYLFSSPKVLKHELSLKLKTDKINVEGISNNEVENVLKSILLDKQDNDTYIRKNGEFGIGIIKGNVSAIYKPKFIGSTARKSFKDETIELFKNEQEEIEKKITQVEQDIVEINKKLSDLNKEYLKIPHKKDLETAINELKEAEFVYNSYLKDLELKEIEAEKTYKKLQEIKQRVYELTNNIELPVNLGAYEEAEEIIDDYITLLNELEKKHLIFLQHISDKELTQSRKEEIDEDIGELSYDLSKIERELKYDSEKKKNYIEQLQLTDFKNIEKEINRCITRLNDLPEEIKQTTRRTTTLELNHKQTCEKLENLDKDITYYKRLNLIYKDGFEDEYALEYVYKKEKEKTLYQSAEFIYNDLKSIEKKNKNKVDYIGNVQEKYHHNRQYMIEYGLKLENIFIKEGKDEDEDISEVISNQKRLDIKGKIRGKYVNLYRLIEYIKEGIEENEKLLRESDRQMFEDILAKTVSKKIRARIYHSETWVKKMNELMESMNTSSGLSFSLSWRSKSAETEEQLDTKELVKLLRKDGNLLNEDEIDNLSSHFRSKLVEARRETEEIGKSRTFHSIMKDVLDYRKWFEFRLYFKKTNENKKEMTNNAFDKFSGGEKAMAMYIPLFSAVYSKYEGARKDCPRIISLDEAFAGVDEKNIRDMFRLLNELELNFIVNSQILWGDYDTIPSLSICELIRPNNADFVTVLRYKWNGKVKELITGEGDGYGQREIATTM